MYRGCDACCTLSADLIPGEEVCARSEPCPILGHEFIVIQGITQEIPNKCLSIRLIRRLGFRLTLQQECQQPRNFLFELGNQLPGEETPVV
jgi:hypothetical protein